MEEWFSIVLRQMMLYSLPVLISLTCVTMIESWLTGRKTPHPFFAIAWRGAWGPLLASIAFHRGIIVALPNPLEASVKSATVRMLSHLLFCLLGFALFSWSLAHQAPAGLPPLHHWWAKVFMFFNLCMVAMHLLPLPGLLAGEIVLRSPAGDSMRRMFKPKHDWLLISLLAASPLPDLFPGALLVFPLYEQLSNLAGNLS